MSCKCGILFLALITGGLAEEPLLLPVEDVFRMSGMGTTVLGTVQRGHLKVGDAVAVIGLGKDAQGTVRGLSVNNKSVPEVKAGEKCGVVLGSLEVVRGQVLAVPGSVTARESFEADVSGKVPAEGSRALLKIWAASVSARVEKVDGQHVTFRMEQPVAAEKGWKFTLLGGASGEITGF